MSVFGSVVVIATLLATIVPALALVWVLGQIRLSTGHELVTPGVRRFSVFTSVVWVSLVLVSFFVVELALAFTAHSGVLALGL